ncbi:MAG: TonB-dependent receptor [Flavobacteriales bacterium]|nr:TonB-dependent receptor [Flavobacteriales bacterium]
MKKTLLLLFIFTSFFAFSQSGNIRGFVYDKESGEPIIFCNVFLEGTTIGAATDINGMYNISKVQPGDYTLTVTYLGYDTTKVEIKLSPRQLLSQNLLIGESSIKLNEVKISAAREEMKTEVKAAAIKISKQDLEMMPTIGGEPDLAQYMQVVPGVVFTGDQGGQLYIRGGSPIQNKVLLDGMIIYSPFHSIGLFSVFDTDIIRNTDVYTGGFNAEYGGRISSIMDIKTIDGNKKNIGGKLTANTFGTKLFLEGPIGSKENTSFIFSGKTSYLDKSSELFYKYPILSFDEKGLPYSYTDLYGKISSKGKNGSKISVFGFNFADNVNYEGISELDWDSKGVGSEFILIPSGNPVLIEGNFAWSAYNISLEEPLRIRQSGIQGFNMGFDFTYFQPRGKLKYGFDIHGFSTNFLTYNSVNSKIEQNENTSEFSAFINYQFNSTRWIIEPGFRLQKYTVGISPEPRLGFKFIISDRMRLKMSSGYYSQNILSTTSDRDVINLFTGIISSPEEIPNQKDGNPYKQKFQKARHLITGIEYDVNNKIDFQIEGYIKDFTQLTNINRDMTSNNDDEFIIESGVAKGFDALAKFKSKKLYVWAVYSLGYVTRNDGNNTYYPHFDRRHNINLVTSYKFGNKEAWKADFRWNLGSGFPFTQTQGFYENLTFSDGINTDYTSVNGELGIEYADLNLGRLPYYHRLDASISKKTKISKNMNLDVTVSVTNAYNRENIFYFNRIKYERVNQLPIMPSLGASLTF